MFELTGITRRGVILPTMNIDKKQRALRFVNDAKSRGALRFIEGGALIAKFDEGHFVTAISGPSY